MKQRHAPTRYLATDRLRLLIDAEGRMYRWYADRLGMSPAQFSRILNGTRTVAEPDARVISTLVGADLGVLFILPEGSDRLSVGGNGRVAA